MSIDPPPRARLRRSALYVPASHARALDKARALPADLLILDLEDAVAPEEKIRARDAALAAVAGFAGREVLIRCNATSTPWGAADLAAIAAGGADGVLVPKIAGPDDIHACHAALTAAPAGVALWAMIETCAAIGALAAIAGCAGTTRLAGFVLGTNDLAKEMRARPGADRAAFLPILTLAVCAARANGLAVLDGVCNAFDDPDRFAAECAQGAALGFDGKTLIHPRQIAPCNAAFSPAAAEIARAHAIVAAFARPETQARGAVQIDGAMVERLHLEEAHDLLRQVALIQAREDRLTG